MKRMIAWALVLALTLSVMPQLSMGVTAEGTPPAAHSHSAAQHNCEHCDKTITWEAWGKTNSLPTSGHYYLTADVTPTAQTKLTGTNDVVLCLNGYTINGEKVSNSILYVQDSAKLTISDCTAYTDAEGVFHAGTIKNGTASGAMSGAIYAKNNCSLAIYNCIFTGNKLNYLKKSSDDGRGGAVQLRGDKSGTASSLHMENVVFESNTSGVSAGALCVLGSTTTPNVTVKKCTFKNNTAVNGGAVYLTKANATFTDCLFEGNESKGGSLDFQGTEKTLVGGTIRLATSTVTLDGCTIKDNTALEGGAIYADASDLTVRNSQITDNNSTANSVGNIQLRNATAMLDGCTIEKNESVGSGGSAVYIHGGSSNVTLKDTTVVNNRHTDTSAKARGGIYVTNKTDKLTVTGQTVVKGNVIAATGDAVERNIFMQNNPNAIDVGGLTNGASISVFTNWGTDTTPTFVTATTAPAAWSSAWVLYENNGMAVDYNETDKFHFVENVIHEHCICGVTGCASTEHEKVLFQPWTGKTELPTSGAYYLTEDVQLDGEVSLDKDLTLCLNGHTVTQTKADNRVIGVTAGTVRITGCKGGTVTGGKAADGGAGINAAGTKTKLELYNITITGNDATDKGKGGGINVVDGAQATVTNVTLSNNTAGTNGAGIAVCNSGKLTMTGGVVTGNTSNADGAGLYVQVGTEATVTGTEFTFNTVTKGSGGGISISGKAVLNNVTVKDNKAGGGAGIVVQGKGGTGNATLNGGTISDNTANGNGGGIYYYLGTLVLNGTVITDNTAKFGGGVYVNVNNGLTVTGDTVIKSNSATNLYLSSTNNVIFDKLTSKAYISVSVKDNAPRAITGTLSQDPTGYVYSDSADLLPEYKDGVLSLVTAVKHTHCLCGGDGTGCDHSNVDFMKWDKKNSLPTSGTYFLDCDVTLTAEHSVGGNLTLCLNGHTITAANNKRILSTPPGGSADIIISDCTAKRVDGVYTAGSFTGGVETSGNSGGGAIYVRTGSSLKFYDGIITGNTTTSGGGAILLGKNVPLTIYDCEIYGNTAVSADGWESGGAIYAQAGCDVKILGGTIRDNKAGSGAGVYYSGAGTMTISNVTFADNTTVVGNAGAVYARTVQTTITGCTFTGNSAKSDGGAVYARETKMDITDSYFGENNDDAAGGAVSYGTNSSGAVTNVTFEKNTASAGAGAMIQNGTNVTMTNVTFKNNETTGVGGAIRLYAATLALTDCTITGNTAKTGAGISAENKAVLTIKNGTISENTATSTAGGVRIDATSSLTLAGAPVISGNADGNLLLVGGVLMDVGAVTDGAEVYLSADMGPISKPCDDLTKYFKSESVYRGVIYKDGALHMATDGSHKHCYCTTAKVSGCDHGNKIEWIAWESTTSLPSSGHYYLLNDVVLTAEQSITSDVSICLNGKTVTAADGQRHISTVKGDAAHIVICDCTATTTGGVYTAGKLTGGVHKTTNTGGGSIYLRSGGSVELFDGIICGNTSDLAGGAIAMNSGSAFTMHGGEISDNKAFAITVDENGAEVVNWKDGGAIFSAPSNDVKILGGTIKNNEGLGGAGIRYNGIGDLLIAGGTITGNIGHGQGAGVFASKATVTITGGQIIGNKTTTSAGGLCLGTGATATMTGGEISGNSAVTGGGFIVQGGSTLTLSSGQITSNTAKGNGGGGAMYSKAQLIMTGGSISNNVSQKDGGGVYVNAAHLELADKALISGNKVTSGSGGGISFGSNSTGKITGGTIEKNTTVKGGGAGLIVQNKANLEITNVTVRNNTAYSSGGGVWVYKATLTISGGTFQGNKSTKSSGGGINATSESVFTMTGGTVKNNSSKTTGGGISVNKCTANLSGVKVTGNSCERDGAGIYNTAGVMNIKGGVVSANNYTKGNGGGFCYGSKSSGYISGMTVYGNSVDGGGGGAIIQNKANVTIGYISITGNTAKKTSGGIYLYKANLTMTGGNISGNTAKAQGGALYAIDSGTVKLSNVTISKNEGKTGGGLYMTRTKLIMKDSVISENASTGSGSGVYTSGGTWKAALAGGEFTNVKFVGNQGGASCSGGAMYVNTDVEVAFTDCEITDNYSENYCGGIYCASGAVPTVINCTFTGNESLKNGGGLYTGDSGIITGCVFKDNKADKGAGLFAGNYMERWHCNGFGNKRDFETGVTITDCTFEDNKAVTDGGGFHLDMSAYTTIDNCTFTGNSAGVAGSAMWLWENCTMTNLTVTGNVCANNGHALVLADSEFDGQTYINGLFKMAGDMIIKDNEGGDLYLDNKTTIGTIMPLGYGPKTHMNVTLDEGLLTQRVDGAYNYEGGDLVYTITYGDRSVTDPEYDPNLVAKPAMTEQTQQNAASNTDVLLYVGIGVIGLAAIAGAVLLILKKKKSASAETK